MATTFRGAVTNPDARREQLQRSTTLNGIDFLEVETSPAARNQRVLRVYFLPPAPPVAFAKVEALLEALDGQPQRFSVRGGTRVRRIRVVDVRRAGDSLAVEVDVPGDFSTYTLSIESALIDPFFGEVDFSFKAACPSRFDCRPRLECAPPERQEVPPIDYMAKDYASFRQALIDLIPTLIPGWTERREADLGMTLLELLAYAGDQLSYFQDAVANEAYLETARQRISVRRHARLIDYALHDGLSATAVVHFRMNAAATIAGERQIQVLTHPAGLPPDVSPIPAYARDDALREAAAIFEVLLEPDQRLRLDPALNEIPIHTWGSEEYYLPRGATNAFLAGVRPLERRDLLLFEEVKGPRTGLPEEHDPAHRQVVRLTKVEPARDELAGVDLTYVEWSADDGLRFPLCVAALRDDEVVVAGVSVARGNLALAYHGRTVAAEEHTIENPMQAHPGLLEQAPSLRHYRFALKQGPLSFHPSGHAPDAPVARLQAATPAAGAPRAVPGVTRLTETIAPGRTNAWRPVMPDLLGSQPFATDFVVETDNHGHAMLRFGDNQFGSMPFPGATLRATYRVGAGRGGNVGADTLVHFIHDTTVPGLNDVAAVRNPIPAWGGADPEPVERVKQVAPAAFHSAPLRAVTEDDYAYFAQQHPGVRKAVATFRWTGSWHTVFVTVDPANTTDLDAALEEDIALWLSRFKLAGYDLEIDGPIFVPMLIDLEVCARPGYFPHDVEQALYEALSNRRFVDGTLGFFHPDNWTFGQPLYLSQLFAAIERVPGVESVDVTRFARRYDSDPEPSRPTTGRNRDRGLIPAGRLEIIRLDNDPSFPENGILAITTRGGR